MALAKAYHLRLVSFCRLHPKGQDLESSILPVFESWASAYTHLKKLIREELPQLLKDAIKTKHYAQVTGYLRAQLSSEIKSPDIRSVVGEALVLYLLLPQKQQKLLIGEKVYQILIALIESHFLPGLDKLTTQRFREKSLELSGLLEPEEVWTFWSYILLPVADSRPTLLSSDSILQIEYLRTYLIKRQLGISTQDPSCKNLHLSTLEIKWFTLSSKNQQKDRPHQDQAHYLTNSFTFLTLSKVSNPGLPILWKDVMQKANLGQQTQLFYDTEANSWPDHLADGMYASILIDLRLNYAYYPFQKKALAKSKQSIQRHLYGKDEQAVSDTELLISRSQELAQPKSLLVLLSDRKILTSKKQQAVRHYLQSTYRQIFIADFCQQSVPDEAGTVALFLVSGHKKNDKDLAKIQYAQYPPSKVSSGEMIEFENTDWTEIFPEKQDYWVGLPSFDFFDQIPLVSTSQGFFKEYMVPQIETKINGLTAHSKKLFQKKIKHLDHAYRSSSKSSDEPLGKDTDWPEHLQKIFAKEHQFEYNDAYLRQLTTVPLVQSYVYADPRLLDSSKLDQGVSLIVSNDQVWTSQNSWVLASEQIQVLPLWSFSASSSYNISNHALSVFKKYYEEKLMTPGIQADTFPNRSIEQLLKKMADASRDLPILRKYPIQISGLLQDARSFTTDVSLLEPLYDKIEEYSNKIAQLERTAVERKVVYQRIKSYIDDLLKELSLITEAYEEANKDLQSVNHENLFYYSLATLNNPDYYQRYGIFLKFEAPRIPLQSNFRQWVAWGIELADLFHFKFDIGPVAYKYQLETLEKGIPRAFTFKIHVDDREIIIVEGASKLTIEDIPAEHLTFFYKGKCPQAIWLEQYANYMKLKGQKIKKLKYALLDEYEEVVIQLWKMGSAAHKISAIRESMSAYSNL